MKIQSLFFKNYKSLVDVKIVNPSPFSVFVGSNASGKSNIFEGIEFLCNSTKFSTENSLRVFGGLEAIAPKRYLHEPDLEINIKLDFGNNYDPYVSISQKKDRRGPWLSVSFLSDRLNISPDDEIEEIGLISKEDFKQFIVNQSRIFVKNKDIEKFKFNDDTRLSTACGNLEKVLKRILKDENKREEIVEWLRLLVPGFENIEIKSEELSGSDNLLIYEIGSNKPFNKSLISDGTYNIIALLTAVYQSDEPQFLCIEEPENGLNPKVVRELVGFFREQCETKGHYIWLNTHSQTLVSELTSEEIILVDKKNGETQIKQIKGKDLHGLRMDEALLSGVLGGGNPW